MKRTDKVVAILTLGTCLLVVFVGFIAMSLLAFTSGFVRASWVVPIAWGWTPCLVALVGLLVFYTHLRRRAGATIVPVIGRETTYFVQVPRMLPTMVAGWVFLAGFILLMFGLSAWLPAALLGSSPASASAQQLTEGPPCMKCTHPVTVTFTTDSGQTITETLAGNNGLNESDGPGTALVYDKANPSHVMLERDWRAGRGAKALWKIAGGAGVLVGLVPAIVLTIRRRRSTFGEMKPSEAISQVRRTSRGAWRIRFADGTRTIYANSERAREALATRISRTQTEISPDDRAALTRAE